MLNPSTADAEMNDPSIRRCVDFATRWGLTELRVVNLFALRSTNPQVLADAGPNNAIGPGNDRHITDEVDRADLIVQGWGNLGSLHARSGQVRKLIRQQYAKSRHFGLNLTGEPRHPLYVPRDTVLSAEPF